MANGKTKTDNRLSVTASKKLQGALTDAVTTLGLIVAMPSVSLHGRHKKLAQECLDRVASEGVAGVT